MLRPMLSRRFHPENRARPQTPSQAFDEHVCQRFNRCFIEQFDRARLHRLQRTRSQAQADRRSRQNETLYAIAQQMEQSLALVRGRDPIEAFSSRRVLDVLENDLNASDLSLPAPELDDQIVEHVLDGIQEHFRIGAFLIKLSRRMETRARHEFFAPIEPPTERTIEIVQVLEAYPASEPVPREPQAIAKRSDTEIFQYR